MTPFPTQISAVTVYPDRARVTRRGKATLEAGLQQLEITELPLQMNRESLRTSARGAAGARLLGAQVQRKFYAETPSEAIRQLEDQIEELQAEIKNLDIQAELIKQQRESLDKISGHSDKFALALAAGEMKVEEELEIFEKLRAEALRLENQTFDLQKTRKEVERRLQKLTKELEQLRGSRSRERFVALVEVEMQQAGELTVELSYVVSNAEWKPIYDLRLVEEGDESRCEVSYLAQVAQLTGENWQGVQLALSTARPALSRSLPELQPWYVRPPALPKPRSHAPMPAALAATPIVQRAQAAPKADMLEAAALEEVEAEVVTAEVDTSGTAMTYTIPGLVDIPPDGTAQKVTIAHFSLVPQMDYLSAPRLVEAVYRRARVTNDSPYTLLPGEAGLFIGDEFIGSTPLELTAPQGEIELSLGVEDRIKVERELKRRDTDKRLIGGRRHLVYGYEIKVENLLPAQAELTLHDQIPVARHEEIKVKLEACEPKPSEQTELNILKWEISLEPKEKATLRFDFSVDSPQGMEVVGLP